MILDVQYEYWGDYGKTFYRGFEEFDTLKEAIEELGRKAVNDALDEDITIHRVIDDDNVNAMDIIEGILEYVAKTKVEDEKTRLRTQIRELNKWLTNVEFEIANRKERVEILGKQLNDLLNRK